jgi:hypothetical protein
VLGENSGKGEASAGDSFYRGRRERGGDRGPTCRGQDAGDLLDQLDHGAHWARLSWVADRWPSVGFSNLARARTVWAAQFIGPAR